MATYGLIELHDRPLSDLTLDLDLPFLFLAPKEEFEILNP